MMADTSHGVIVAEHIPRRKQRRLKRRALARFGAEPFACTGCGVSSDRGDERCNHIWDLLAIIDAFNFVWRRDGRRCRYCGTAEAPAYHVDHVEPWSRGGLNDPGNLVVACAPCNLRKGARTPIEAGMALLPPPETVQ